MKNKLFTYERPLPLTFLLAGITCVLIYLTFQLKIGSEKNSKYDIFSIEFDYFGMDAERLEKLITIPLEEKLSLISGSLEIRSTSEYGKSVTSIYFPKGKMHKKNYLLIRAAVEDLYASLPQDVQKPRILTSDSADKGVICIALSGSAPLDDLRFWAENNLKKKIERIDGVSEVEIYGGNQKEILVAFDSEKMIANAQNPYVLAGVIQDGNAVQSGTAICGDLHKQGIGFDTRFHSLSDMKMLPVKVGESLSSLGYIAEVLEEARRKEELVRINGEETVCLNVKASSDGNCIGISSECRKILGSVKKEAGFEVEYSFLFDEGIVQKKLLNSVLAAFLQSFILVSLVLPFFFKSIRMILLTVGSLLLTCLWTIGLLALFKISINQNSVAGISIALGLVVDSSLLLAEEAERAACKLDFFSRVKAVRGELVSAVITSLIVLIPLYFMDEIVPGLRVIAVTIFLMLVVSLVLNLVFLPAFLYSGQKITNQKTEENRKFWDRLVYKTNKLLERGAFWSGRFSLRMPDKIRLVYVALAILPVVLLLCCGKNLNLEDKNSIFYVSVDFEPELSVEGADKAIYDFVQEFKLCPGIKYIKSDANKGFCEIEIGFDEKKINSEKLSKLVEEKSVLVQEGFVYSGGNSLTDKNGCVEVELAVTGDSSEGCREYAELSAELLSECDFIGESVLNFKRKEKQVVFEPERDKICKNGLSVEDVAVSLRWMLFGPVADKWLNDGFEQDIRISSEEYAYAGFSALENLKLPSDSSFVNLNSLGKIERVQKTSKIYRKNGRRAAFFTVTTNSRSATRTLALIKEKLSEIQLDKGYAFSYPRELELLSGKYRKLFAVYLLTIVAILILITALSENPVHSLVIVSIIPVSICFPLLLLFVLGKALELSYVVGIVVLAGICVNNSIYIVESGKISVVFKLRERIKSIFLTTLTTVLGSVPLFLFSRDAFSRGLALFMFLGVLSSFFVSVFLFPKFFKYFQNQIINKSSSNKNKEAF